MRRTRIFHIRINRKNLEKGELSVGARSALPCPGSGAGAGRHHRQPHGGHEQQYDCGECETREVNGVLGFVEKRKNDLVNFTFMMAILWIKYE